MSLTGVADSVERLEAIASSTARHVLGAERNTDILVETVENRVMPNDEHWYRLLQKDLADLLDRLPQAIVRNLIKASRHQFANYMDDCKVSLCKSVESLFHRVHVSEIQSLPESSKLMLTIPRGKRPPLKRSPEEWNKIPMSEWVQILNTSTEGDMNEPPQIGPSSRLPQR